MLSNPLAVYSKGKLNCELIFVFHYILSHLSSLCHLSHANQAPLPRVRRAIELTRQPNKKTEYNHNCHVQFALFYPAFQKLGLNKTTIIKAQTLQCCIYGKSLVTTLRQMRMCTSPTCSDGYAPKVRVCL